MPNHVLVIPSLTFTIHSDLASFFAENDLKKELQRHLGIFFWMLVFAIEIHFLVFLWYFLVKAHCFCFRYNTISPTTIRNLKPFHCILRTPSINKWRSAHGGEADYWVEISSASEKVEFFPTPDFFPLTVGSTKRRYVKD